MAAFTENEMKDFKITDWYDLSGQVAVVTGGSTGLAITRCLVSAGAKVCVVSFESPEQAAEALEGFGDRTVFYQFDITDTSRAQELVDRIVQEQGRVDILVNNAGNHCKKFIWDMTVEDYKRVLEVHLVGSFAMTNAVVPYMKGQKSFLGMIHTLTAELAEFGVTVNAIAPGWIDTPMFHQAVDNDPPRLAKIMGRIPAKTVGDPMDVGMCAAFLCSDAARYISGSCIPVDGGALIGF